MIDAADADSIERAARVLASGGLVAFPTETVYGLGADASSRDAVARIYALKGRPAGHPLIVHVADAAGAVAWAVPDARADRLIARFWPGPLSLVLTRAPDAPAWACGGQPSIGLRCPSHPVARALLARFEALGGRGVAAPSANRFGRVSPTRAAHVVDDLGADAPMVLDGGASEVGVESTIVDLTRARPVLLRPGRVDRAAIEALLGERLADRDAQAPRASGTLASHYRPQAPVTLLAADTLEAGVQALGVARVAVWSRERPAGAPAAWEAMPSDARLAEAMLYDTLRRLDARAPAAIVVESPPPAREWDAVRDRLMRASTADTPPAEPRRG